VGEILAVDGWTIVGSCAAVVAAIGSPFAIVGYFEGKRRSVLQDCPRPLFEFRPGPIDAPGVRVKCRSFGASAFCFLGAVVADSLYVGSVLLPDSSTSFAEIDLTPAQFPCSLPHPGVDPTLAFAAARDRSGRWWDVRTPDPVRIRSDIEPWFADRGVDAGAQRFIFRVVGSGVQLDKVAT
jgi:hypothetical protein